LDRIVAHVHHGGAPAGWLDFSANPNPLGTPASVREAIAAVRYDRYADLDARGAEEHLASDAGVPPDAVLLTAGATEALWLITRAHLSPGVRAVIAGPTYGEYARLAGLGGAAVRELRARPPSFDPPTAGLAKPFEGRSPRVVIACDPNNPTGRAIGEAGCGRLLAALGELGAGSLLVLDQSFAPFSQERLPEQALLATGRVLLVRSLTKALAIPGVRVGYVVGSPVLLAQLRSVRDPWTVGSHAIAAASVAQWVLSPPDLATVAAWREALVARLATRGLQPVPSQGPFVLIDAGPMAGEIIDALARERIAVRDATSFDLPGYLRVAVRPPADQARLFETLDAVVPVLQVGARADHAR
jgi:threonine-phosphate decarboxylase